MEYLIVMFLILVYSSVLTIILKKRIEETILISVTMITIIVYLAGLLNNLKLGVMLVGVIGIVGIFIMFYNLFKGKSEAKEILKRIITPGLIVYVILSLVFICLNKGRIFEDYDEFNHWARIVKNMFIYNTYGVNEESIILFNEYPPFTAVFQYIFLAVKNVYSEEVVLTASSILYFSIIIPITKNIEWKRNLKNLIIIIPSIVFIPVIFYENFYLNILVDGILGIMFANVIFSFYKEQDVIYKYIKILALLIMLTLTKTSGIALALLAIIIIFIKLIIDRKNTIFKKEIRNLIIVTIVVAILTGIWYIKIGTTEKRWDFNQYIQVENKTKQEQKEVASTFLDAIIHEKSITDKDFTVLTVFLVIICINFYTLKKASEQGDKKFKYYANAMIITIPIYLLFVLITYTTIFDIDEANRLTSFERYCSTILLANLVFQMLAIYSFSIKVNFQKIVLLCTIIIAFLPYQNFYDKYINAENYKTVSNINRSFYTKFSNYSNKIEKNSQILFIVGKDTTKHLYIQSINEYASNIKINKIEPGIYKNEEQFKSTAKKYNYIFIYRMDEESKIIVEKFVKNSEVNDNTLYKVVNKNNAIVLERIGSK